MPKPSEEVKFIIMIIAILSQLTQPWSQLTIEAFPWKWVVLERSLHFTPGLQSSVCSLCLTLNDIKCKQMTI